MARTTASSATLCSAITVSSGCCSPVTNAASAHTGHHTCWHLPGSPPALARARRPCAHRGVEAVQDRLRQLTQLGPDVVGPVGGASSLAGHTSGFGRKRTVSSLPRELGVHHDASPQHRRQPNPAPHPADADDQVVVDPAQRQRRRSRPAATLAASGTPHRARTRTPGRPRAAAAPAAASRPAGARRRAVRRAPWARSAHPPGAAPAPARRRRWCVSSSSSTARCSAIRSAYQSNAGCSGRLRYSYESSCTRT